MLDLSDENSKSMVGLKALKAVIFDMDGVLVDSMPYHADAWVIVFAEAGIYIKRKDIYEIEGSNHEGIIRLIFKKAGKTLKKEDIESFSRKKREIFSRINKAKVFEGMHDCLNFLKGRCLLGVVSGSDRGAVLDIIERFFPDTFDAVVSGNDVKQGKPSPEPYLKALFMLGVRKNECVVIENAPLGVESAKRAGLCCIAIPTYVEASRLKNADIVLERHAMLKECLSRFL